MLLTKLHIPSVVNNIVHRTTLNEKLNIGLSRKLILVSAPAGFGKTTVVSDWINQNNITTAWFSLDKGDNDPVEFLSYVISGIQSIQESFGQNTLNLLQSTNKPSNASIASLLINEIIGIDQNFLLVLDDFHLINNTEIIELIAFLLEHLPNNIHIVILTRSDPALPVARLRSQHQMVELRSSDLSFSTNDISTLFNKKLKLGLSSEDVITLETKTEGWIAGLQLTALSMQGREDIPQYIQELKGDNRYIMDYLIEEVLRIQSDDTKEFLLQTSILEQMSASLCNSVLGRNDSQIILEQLEKNNMFLIPLDDERNWFRYHHLFAQLLKQRFQQSDHAAINKLHNKASEWFQYNSMSFCAIDHAIAAGDFEKSIQILGEITESLWKNGQHSAIMKYGDLIPDEIIKKNADFCLYYAWILIIAGQIPKAEPFLICAERISRQVIEDENSSKEDILSNKKLLGKISVAFAYLYSLIENSEKIFDYTKTAMENLSDDDPLWFSWGWYAIGIAESVCENFMASIEAYEKALVYGKKTGNIYLLSTIAINVAYLETRMGLYESSHKKCSDLLTFMKENGYSQIAKSESTFAGLYSCLAGIESMWTEYDEALENINIAYNLCLNESNISYKLLVLVVYSFVLYGRGDVAGAERKISELEYLLKQYQISPGVLSLYVALKGLMLIEQNQYERAHQFFIESGVGPDNKITYINEAGYCPYVLLLITESKFDLAESLLYQLFQMAQAEKRIERMVELKIIYSIFYKMTGKREKAIGNLIESFEYAAKDSILMPYIIYYGKINDLLKEVYTIQATSKTIIPDKIIDKLKYAIEKREKLIKSHSDSELSAREIEILQLFIDDLSNQEIADKLFISLNTVKSHVKNIYLKLEVDNRAKAIGKAKELGLL
jgi:LuxR family transcriptional regulator, maltose regulon positive regulatory protein